MRRALPTILVAGLVAGTLDGLAACIQYTLKSGKNPINVFYYIASGVFGIERAYGSGPVMAVLGILFHYFIATSWAAAFYVAYPRLSRIPAIALGILYGAVIWAVMNLVVLSLSNIPPRGGFQLAGVAKAMATLMICVGLPIAFIVRRHYRREGTLAR